MGRKEIISEWLTAAAIFWGMPALLWVFHWLAPYLAAID